MEMSVKLGVNPDYISTTFIESGDDMMVSYVIKHPGGATVAEPKFVNEYMDSVMENPLFSELSFGKIY